MLHLGEPIPPTSRRKRALVDGPQPGNQFHSRTFSNLLPSRIFSNQQLSLPIASLLRSRVFSSLRCNQHRPHNNLLIR